MRVTFVMEQQVGLRTYAQNLRSVVDSASDVDPTWAAITYEEPGGWIERLRALPAGLRGTLRGRRQVRTAVDTSAPDVVLFFTQVPAVLAGRKAQRHPYVIVLDVTPIQYDQMGEHYGHSPDRFAPVRRLKKHFNDRTLQNAAFLLPWSNWARESLIDDYDVDPARIEVIPAGVDIERWVPGEPDPSGPLRVLFVGGEFERKGGPTVLRALESLPRGSYQFHVVTRSDVAPSDDVFVYRDMEPNSERLRALFRSCGVFVMPSLAETFGQVVVEAAASGLPAIVSDVGGMPETVAPDETGFVVRPGDHQAIGDLLQRFVDDPELRVRMGTAARARAETCFSAGLNGRRTIERLREASASTDSAR
jgi:glycosyltransferase involved in cell wall biosynthesis